MRTTVTLDPDTAALVRRQMRERGQTFKEALNELLSTSAAAAPRFRTEVASMGRPTVNLDRALQLAGELDDEELLRRARAGK